MPVNTFIQETRNTLLANLQRIPGEQAVDAHYKACVGAVDGALETIKNFMNGYTFQDQAEEIEYFKDVIPSVLEQGFYYSTLYDLSIDKHILNRRRYRQQIGQELKAIDRFLVKNYAFYAYCLRRETEMDTYYFTRTNRGLRVYDERVCTGPSYLLGKLLGFTRCRKDLETQLATPTNGPQQRGSGIEGFQVEFTGTDADLVEVVPPVHRLKLLRINGKEPTQEGLLDLIDGLFQRSVKKNFSTIDNKNRLRKKSTHPFLDRLIEAYDQRSEELLK